MKSFWKNAAVTVLAGGMLLGLSVGAQARERDDHDGRRDRREQRYDDHSRNRDYRNGGYYNGYYGRGDGYNRNDRDRDDRGWYRNDNRYRRDNRHDYRRDREDDRR